MPIEKAKNKKGFGWGKGIAVFFTLVGISALVGKKNYDQGKRIDDLKQKNKMGEELLGYIKKYFKPKPFKPTGKLEADVATYTLVEEGGLTDNPLDGASKDPVGISFTYKGKTTDKWHTNKGITWTAFKKKFGTPAANVKLSAAHKALAARFYAMNSTDWYAVFNDVYIKPFATRSNNKLINFELGLWAWGSGVGGATKSLQSFELTNGKLQDLINKNALEAFEKICLHRIKFFEYIATVQPNLDEKTKAQRIKNQKFLPGWINRTLNFYENFKQYA